MTADTEVMSASRVIIALVDIQKPTIASKVVSARASFSLRASSLVIVLSVLEFCSDLVFVSLGYAKDIL